jgi:hypothetical protein
MNGAAKARGDLGQRLAGDGVQTGGIDFGDRHRQVGAKKEVGIWQ